MYIIVVKSVRIIFELCTFASSRLPAYIYVFMEISCLQSLLEIFFLIISVPLWDEPGLEKANNC